MGTTHRLSRQELSTMYFDTADLRLWHQGLSLRHRTGESADAGTWTLKLPTDASGPTLDRTELSWPGGRDSIPTAVTDLVRGIARRSPLEPITELVTTRRRLELCDEKGASCAELDDDTVTVVGGRRDGLQFRQLELEVGPGGEGILAPVVAALRRAGAHPGGQPKLAKALGLPASRRPAKTGKRSQTVLADVVQASIADGLDRLLDHDYRLRLDAGDPDPDDVHQARVATRRLRSDLKTFSPLLDPVWSGHIRAELKWLGEAYGRVRDADVRSGLLTAELDVAPVEAQGLAELQSIQGEQRRRAAHELAAVVSGVRYLDLLDRLDAAAQRPPFVGRGRTGSAGESGVDDRARRVLPALVGRQWRVLHRRVRTAGRHPTDEALHRVRIAAKQLRYAAEAAAPTVGRTALRTAKAAERLQTVLGEHHDAVAAEEWLRHEAMRTTTAGAFAAGRLTDQLVGRKRKLRRRWRPVADEITGKKVRGWLD